MVESPKSWNVKRFFTLILVFLIATDIAILLNIAFLRPVFGFLFLTILPGLLIIQILKLDKIGYTEKFVLSAGLSISFLMLFGLVVNNLSLYFGYETPLATTPLLISFNLAFIVLATIGCMINQEPIFSCPNLNLTTPEKAFLIVPILFPALIIFGMHVMNTTDNNIVLMFLLLLIPVYVVFVSFLNQKFPERIYPVVIFLISISLSLLLALRLNHIIGVDVHLEYFLYHATLYNLYWDVCGHSTLDACLSISLLPTIYQSILNIEPEFLYKILHSILFSISPLAVFIISKKYIGAFYAFLASFFFMAQLGFLSTPMLARTNTAVLFTTLAFMVLFHEGIGGFNKKLFFIIFMISCIISHYSTTYIFFFILLLAWIGMPIVTKILTHRRKIENTCSDTIARNAPKCKKGITTSIVVLFFTVLFFWYSQVTVVAFNSGVSFVYQTFVQLNQLFMMECSHGQVQQAMGAGTTAIPQKIKFVVYWLMIAYIGIGILYSMIKYKKVVSISDLGRNKADFLKSKIDAEYFTISLICIGLLVFSFITPIVLKGYDMSRAYFQVVPVMSMFFVIGGIALAKFLKFRHYKVIILIILIPIFLCSTDVVSAPFDIPTKIVTLNSDSFYYNYFRIYDQDIYGGRWVKDRFTREAIIRPIYTDVVGRNLVSQADIPWSFIDTGSIFINDTKIYGYIYLRHYNVIDGKLLDGKYEDHNLTECDKFTGKGKIYANGGSEVWK